MSDPETPRPAPLDIVYRGPCSDDGVMIEYERRGAGLARFYTDAEAESRTYGGLVDEREARVILALSASLPRREAPAPASLTDDPVAWRWRWESDLKEARQWTYVTQEPFSQRADFVKEALYVYKN